VYRREFLLALSGLEKTPLETAEGLEMLRALEHGYDVRVVIGDFTSVSVDTEDDLKRVRQLVGERR
jgi:3-deoxy-manno-octulosonate cytidylyltransferase (CMP-KDO synthetase)